MSKLMTMMMKQITNLLDNSFQAQINIRIILINFSFHNNSKIKIQIFKTNRINNQKITLMLN